MTAASHVTRVKRACVLVRLAHGPTAVGVAVAVEVSGHTVLVTDAAVEALLADGSARLALGTATTLGIDAEHQVAVLELPAGATAKPLRHFAIAPLPDGEPLLVTGFGATLRLDGAARHLWVTRQSGVAGHVHAFDGTERLPDFGYLLDLPAGALPPGSPVYRREDGALAGLLAGGPGPVPEMALARPIREVVELAERLLSEAGRG